MEICFICNTKSDDWLKLNEVKSQHTNTPIVDLLKKILSTCETKRNIHNGKNCICSDCLNRIDEYDWACVMAKKHEKGLCNLFKKTETLYANISAISGNSENHSKKVNSGVDLLPQVKAGHIQTIQFGSTTIRKITVDAEPKKRESARQSKAAVEIGDESSEHEDDMDDDYVPSESDDEYLPTPRKLPKGRPPKQNATRTIPSHSNLTVKRIIPTSSGEKGSTETDKQREGITKRRPGQHERPVYEYPCHLCEKIFTKKIEFLAHEKWHKQQSRPQFSCLVCSFVLDDQKSLDAHHDLHEDRPDNECVICDKKLSSRGNLTIHMRIHGEPTFICYICGKKFIHETSFTAHMKCHANLREYSCPHCPMKFNLDVNLRTHLQTHNQDKPFTCKICGKKFGYIKNMRTHEKLHTETDKIHECSMCDAKFARRTKMIQHMEKQHSTTVSHWKNIEPHTSLQNTNTS